ncbi:sigma-70 family RNA polymerase sigma factor [Streptomyces sp. NBC_00237]|uniref:sigma-70 family RNA polymerase sigma factor n=1 Tax=Streptomyces sp. NBC_00237 TaxID=2975687 RepID=UPI00224CC31A|nr:sigma-70 family RNA polymerase sigma factor [Streptomyces sp. NBC_00237]MCX5199865.1 sigma-70 family RNA polymerase sigma factor [Streptomyces sp. NBC_00237]
MGVDERDESLGDGDDNNVAESSDAGAGLPPRQVPSQGGPLGATPAPDVERGPDPTSVPQQRGGGTSRGEPGPSDADLVERMRAGDDGAYEELFRRHSDAVRRYARTCCRDAHTADDLTAEVFARTLQAVRGGAGPQHAVRAYLMTTVRRVAAAWTKTARREQLVEDFAVFVDQAARASEARDDDTLDLGADVRAMHEAEQTLAMQAFRSLPERWQAVLWHTTVEEESPSEVAPLFGLTANATAVLASRAREGLKQAYLQAHVSTALTAGGDCAQYADRLGAYARGGLRMRAERGLRKHLEECAKCRLAAGELRDVNAGIPALLPVAVIGWVAAGYAVKAAGVVAGGVGVGAGVGAGAAAGAGGAASGGAGGSGGAAGGGAVAEGLGAPAKVGIGAAVAVAVTAGLVFAFAGDEAPIPPKVDAKPRVVKPSVPKPLVPKPKPSVPPVVPPPAPRPTPSEVPKPSPTPSRAKPKPPAPPVKPAPRPPKPRPTPPPPPAPAPKPEGYPVAELAYSPMGDHTEPEVRIGESSAVWQRADMSIGGVTQGSGISVPATSSVVIDLNRRCSTYDARVGVDDMTMGSGAVRFSVYGDGALLWRSPVLRGGDGAVGVHVGIAGRKVLRLVTESVGEGVSDAAFADWAGSRIGCG